VSACGSGRCGVRRHLRGPPSGRRAGPSRPATGLYRSRIIRVAAILGVCAAVLAGEARAATFRVVVVPGLQAHDLRPVADRGAVGLLVAGAGPETGPQAAEAMLARGVVRNSLRAGL